MAETNLRQEQLKEKFMQFQALQQYIEQVAEHVRVLNQQYAELESSKEALREFSERPVSKVLAPIVNGVFFKAEAKDNLNLLVNVGAGMMVEKPITQIVEMLAEQQKETLQQTGEANRLLQEFQQQAAQIYREVEALQ
ncbi:MAG TPA: prefoldin subunit alpha [Candidatus Nanoarchaeia archaeon]|nr:prefoldin subunit alpha [Candidatus Nanoarchaeia archaeon]